MTKIEQPRLAPFFKEAAGQPIGICIPCYNHVDNDGLAQAIWTMQMGSDLPYQLALGIGRACVAKNRNKALARLDPDIKWVLMSDDDILAPPGFLSLLMKPFLEHPDIGVVSATMLGARGEKQNDCYPGNIPEGQELLDRKNPPGTFFLYNRERTPIEFDERYLGSQWEDTDAMRQVQAVGLRTVITNRVTIMHKNNWSQNKYWEDNKRLFASKWGLPS